MAAGDLIATSDFGLIGFGQVGMPGTRRFAIVSKDPAIVVTGKLAGKPVDGTPRPKYVSHERPGDVDLVQYTGHEPFEQQIPIKFDGGQPDQPLTSVFGTSIEGKIHQLYQLAKRTSRDQQPPVVKVQGPGVLHPSFDWRIVTIAPDDGRTLYVPVSGDRRFWVATITLRQQVTERVLSESLKAFNRKGAGQGLRNRLWTVREGERTVYDVARHAFHDPSAARDIAIANPGTFLSTRLRVGQKLRLP